MRRALSRTSILLEILKRCRSAAERFPETHIAREPENGDLKGALSVLVNISFMGLGNCSSGRQVVFDTFRARASIFVRNPLLLADIIFNWPKTTTAIII